MMTPLGWLERVPSFKDQQAKLQDKDLNMYGFLGYPLLQTADIIIYRASYVPVGEDQASHLELSREIVRRFNNFYGDVFPEPQPLFTATPIVPGLDGQKMSKSYNNTIPLTASADEVRALVMTMFTDPNRIRRKDPGNPDICNLFQFHKLFSDEATIGRVDRECRTAMIGCVDDKKLLAEIMIEKLRPIRARRDGGAESRSGRRLHLHGGAAHPHQVEDAVAARRERAAARGSATGAGRSPPRIPALQGRGGVVRGDRRAAHGRLAAPGHARAG